MQYEVSNPDQYFLALDDDWRKEKLIALRQVLLDLDGNIAESINYKMLCYKLNEVVICHLNAQKNAVSLYVGNVLKVDPSGELLSGYNVGKGCIRLSKTKSIDAPNFQQFLQQMVTLTKQGVDLSC